MKVFTGQDVTVYISTKNRYFTTLPLAIQSILNQSVTPKNFILWDDGEHKDLRGVEPYRHLFRMLDYKGISWKVNFSNGHGQVKNHEWMRQNAETRLIFRVDDDNVLDDNCLSHLLNTFNDEDIIGPTPGAVAGMVLDPTITADIDNASTLLKYVDSCPNVQWCNNKLEGYYYPEHLYSTFLYLKDAATHSYNTNLSIVGHREETMFTHQILMNGHTLVINPQALTWHYRSSNGGIRSETDKSLWQHDEAIFQKWLAEKDIKLKDSFWIVLDSGIGDHYMFIQYLDEIIEKYYDKRIRIACCHPAVFEKYKQIVNIESIETAKSLLGNLDKYNLYKLAIDLNWDRHIHLLYRKIYL